MNKAKQRKEYSKYDVAKEKEINANISKDRKETTFPYLLNLPSAISILLIVLLF